MINNIKIIDLFDEGEYIYNNKGEKIEEVFADAVYINGQALYISDLEILINNIKKMAQELDNK